MSTDAPRPSVLRTTAGDFPLEEYAFSLEHRTWRILHTGAIISHADEARFLGADQPHVPYGLALWPSAIALAHEVAARGSGGGRVLELGAGTGLPGIVAASLGRSVVQTDRQEVALHVAETNATRNGVTTIAHRAADWTAWEDADTYDWILGADILYATRLHAHLRRIFERNLAPGGRLFLADPFRGESFPFLEAMEADGWNVTMNKWMVSVAPPARAVGVFELTRS